MESPKTWGKGWYIVGSHRHFVPVVGNIIMAVARAVVQIADVEEVLVAGHSLGGALATTLRSLQLLQYL